MTDEERRERGEEKREKGRGVVCATVFKCSSNLVIPLKSKSLDTSKGWYMIFVGRQYLPTKVGPFSMSHVRFLSATFL